MPERFIFRQVQSADLNRFLNDGEIRAKNCDEEQKCHQASYQSIVDRRGSREFPVPLGGVVNDYVPFYFSPLTAYAYAIHSGCVDLISPSGECLGRAKSEDRIFFVGKISNLIDSGLEFCFSNYALNSRVPAPAIETNIEKLEQHVHWDVFDDTPMVAKIPEIGYNGVCKYFVNKEEPANWQTRKEKRMAEFLVRGAFPLEFVECIITYSNEAKLNLGVIMEDSEWNIPVIHNRGCFF